MKKESKAYALDGVSEVEETLLYQPDNEEMSKNPFAYIRFGLSQFTLQKKMTKVYNFYKSL